MIFINAHFLALVQNHGEIKGWRIKLWRIGYQLPNPPKFSPANVLCYTVINQTINGIHGNRRSPLKEHMKPLYNIKITKCALFESITKPGPAVYP